ncbi:flagellar basal body P-ring formation chaperone FlgA [Paludibacterium paludis]|uniref:Flagella basal body P-ring formation protein FlgA n=1 Tax=Paludibacterium paludis TaxID=1225769 RepID=A0A918U6W6_9NEIS|nr:flagellar basal body P-ring formation chaperone FlgA [Paludibacterium paludis]GGY02171.1 hypothetical protein GCM10011289_00290 [Paludibacterium paludis]
MKLKIFTLMAALAAALIPAPLLAANQDLSRLEETARKFVAGELAQRKARWTIGRVDRRLAVPACDALFAGWAQGARQTGSTFVDVSCPSLGWSLRVPVSISETRVGVVANRALRAGETIGPDDVRLVDMPEGSATQTVLGDLSLAVGQTMTSGVPAGGWLRSFMVKAPVVVKMNQRVKVLAIGEGFMVSADGTAMANAAAGDSVPVRMGAGRVIRGTVREDGAVIVVF